MVRKRVYIHIGLAKTGTKSIQFALSRRRTKLTQAGWNYPLEGTTNKRSGHHGFAWHLQDVKHRHPGIQRFEVSQFKAAIARAENENIIISSEGLSRLSRSEEGVSKLLGYFPNHEPFVVAYVREQADLVNSLYGEILSSLTYPGCIESYAGRVRDNGLLDYAFFFRHWRRTIPGRLIVRPFDLAELAKGDVVTDFASQLAIAAALKPYSEDRRNAGYNVLQIAMLQGLVQWLARHNVRWEQYSEFHRHLRRTVSRILDDEELQHAEAYWGLSSDVTKNLRQYYRESNRSFFLDSLGKAFEFSSVQRSRLCNALAYDDLSASVRSRGEEILSKAIVERSEIG